MAEKISLSELQLIIRDSLYMSLPDMFWVIAEISELRENTAGHCYLELIEKQPDDKNVRARIKAIIWSSRYRFLKSFFENTTGESLREGLKVLVKAKIEYHEIYGLSLVISDIDPAFTLGDMAVKRQMIIRRLEQEGILTMNKELDFPLLPQRIAVISSKNAAGYSDFINHIRGNSPGYVFYTALIDSAMQGSETEEGIINALNRIAEQIHLFDLVVIIRGGGSQTDLSWFDNYNIAYYITQFPIPVLTGIGHDKDMSVTDIVANKALKTPTAVADFLIDCTASTENHLIDMGNIIRDCARVVLEENRNLLESMKLRLLPNTQIHISEKKEKISGILIELINFGKEYTFRAGRIPSNQASRLISGVKSYINAKGLSLERSGQNMKTACLNSLELKKGRITGMESSLNMLDPENVLKRGFTITTLNGKIIKTRENIKTDDIIDTQFSDGKIARIVIEKNKMASG